MAEIKNEKKEEYNFVEAEARILKFWLDNKTYKFDGKKKGKIYSVDTPPPTVSGKMHIGHSCSYSQQDFAIRFRRMMGENIFYPFGTDDNGLPTERLVEKTYNIKAKDMERSKFIELCTEFLKKELPRFIQDWKNIGISADFDVYYSTINEHSRRISQWSFLDLYKKGRAERRDAPSMWCPECRTGVSQVEIKDKELESQFNHIKFSVGGKDLVIATTRPELLPACVAIFYHPGDKRFEKLKGKKAKVPLFNFEVPIMEDERASMEKGTGIVMCCTFGDQTDMEWQKAHRLVIKEAISRDGKMTGLAGKYAGMVIKEARKAIIEDLKKENLLVHQERIKHFVNVHERCDTEIEFVKSRQWFIRYLDLKEKMLSWGEKLNWHPGHMKHRYDNWVKGLQWDWLISNQRHFGVPFPVWYCKKCGEVILADEKDLPVDPLKDKPGKKCKCGSGEFEPEKDILNTWFTSSMTPQLCTWLIPEMKDKLFPMSLRPQAHDIITFWLFNTVFKSNIHFGKNPWKDVIISGFVTLGGEKMSKSKGNVIEPQVVLDKYGADALRFWASGSKLGEDMDYQEKELVAGRKFVTKIWNATKFVFMNLQPVKKPKKIIETDRLFLSRLNRSIEIATESFSNYEYSKARQEAFQFFWHVFCDNYLEIVKNRVYQGTREEKESAFYTLYQSLLAVLKMMAPITPFICEELYQNYFKKYEKDVSIHLSSWPEKVKIKEGKDDSEVLDNLVQILGDVRMAKSKAQKSMKAEIILTLNSEKQKKLAPFLEDFKSVMSVKEMRTGEFRVEFI
jgi:valyl-tRNA synthetase